MAFQLTIKMSLGKSTKGTHVYNEVEEDSGIRSLYISKAAFEGEPPKQIVVAIKTGGKDGE